MPISLPEIKITVSRSAPNYRRAIGETVTMIDEVKVVAITLPSHPEWSARFSLPLTTYLISSFGVRKMVSRQVRVAEAIALGTLLLGLLLLLRRALKVA